MPKSIEKPVLIIDYVKFQDSWYLSPVYDRMSGSGPVYRKFPAFFDVRFRFSGTGHLPANRTFA